jgi:signal transduction histidine kinase
MALYRIAQEALNNVAKHARASRVTVSLACSASGVELRIRDDGRGFQAQDRSPDHLGLGIMRERAEAVGARLTISSPIGRGTVVRVVWQERATPLLREAAK